MTLHFELVLGSVAIVLVAVYLTPVKLLSSCPWLLPGPCAIPPDWRLDPAGHVTSLSRSGYALTAFCTQY